MIKPYYEKENIIIYNDNCLDIIKELQDESIDLVVTDPPYNIGDTNKRTKVGNKIVSNMEAWGEWDNYDKKEYDEFIFKLIAEMYRVLKKGGSLYMFSAREDNGFFIREAVRVGFTYRNQLAIIKTNPLPLFVKNNYRSAFELCFYVTKGKPKTFNFLSQQDCINIYPYIIGKKYTKHPTEKPLGFIEKIVKISSNENDTVLDPFIGSGTTAVACKNLNRKCIGVEINKKYCDMSIKRLGYGVLNFEYK